MTKCIVKVVLLKLEQKEFTASKERLLERRSSSLTSHLRNLLNSYRSQKNSRLSVQFLPVTACRKPSKITCFFFNMHVFKLTIKTTNTQKKWLRKLRWLVRKQQSLQRFSNSGTHGSWKSITRKLPRSKFVTSVIQEDRKDLNSVQEICKGGAKYKKITIKTVNKPSL